MAGKMETIDFKTTALLEIDVQNDFCPLGALAVTNGDAVIEPLNALAHFFAQNNGKVVLTADWHPKDHISFSAPDKGRFPGDIIESGKNKGQAIWPTHCVQGSSGAAFHKDLDLRPASIIIRKGTKTRLDSYSAFFENDKNTQTGLDGYLKSLNIDTLILGGLATDYCVCASALDAVKLGFKTILLLDAVRGVGYPQGSVEDAMDAMEKAGVGFVQSHKLC
jgi:nicotinamidase/pyrazinamidase